MSQSKVTSFYSTRKNARNINTKLNSTELSKNIHIPTEENNIVALKCQDFQLKTHNCDSKFKTQESQSILTTDIGYKGKAKSNKVNDNTKPKRKTAKRDTKNAKTTSKKGIKPSTASSEILSQSKVTNFYNSTKNCDDGVAEVTLDPESIEKITPAYEFDSITTLSHEITTIEKKAVEVTLKTHEVSDTRYKSNIAIPQSPKRNLPHAAEGTPPKKKPLLPKEDDVDKESSLKEIRRKLILVEERELGKSCTKTNQTIGNQKKIVPNVRSEETTKALASFKDKLSKIRSYEANSCKVTSVISSTPERKSTSALPSVHAYQRYNYLVDPDVTSLILPFKYRLLSEMFRSLDTVISILNNRKEKITFEKVKDGVEKMMRRNFSKNHLGQIVTVMASAYEVTLEKCTFKKVKDPDYQLIISPVLTANKGTNSKKESNTNVTMTPQDLLGRKNEFNNRLLNLVKNHHLVFLSRLNVPPVPAESIKRWHPKFQVDSVPDIEVANLPEIPETKIYTAKDVLNKVAKGSFRGKVVKALESVAEVSETSNIKNELEQNSNKPKTPATKSALKGVCADLLAKVRARESAKLLGCMTEGPDEVKKKAMLERLPKIIQILWHYFIAERKAAVAVDAAVEKIIHSFNSLSTYDEVKAHLTLITETFPGWLSFIQIPKGLYITMDKNRNITEMLDKFHH